MNRSFAFVFVKLNRMRVTLPLKYCANNQFATRTMNRVAEFCGSIGAAGKFTVL